MEPGPASRRTKSSTKVKIMLKSGWRAQTARSRSPSTQARSRGGTRAHGGTRCLRASCVRGLRGLWRREGCSRHSRAYLAAMLRWGVGQLMGRGGGNAVVEICCCAIPPVVVELELELRRWCFIYCSVVCLCTPIIYLSTYIHTSYSCYHRLSMECTICTMVLSNIRLLLNASSHSRTQLAHGAR